MDKVPAFCSGSHHFWTRYLADLQKTRKGYMLLCLISFILYSLAESMHLVELASNMLVLMNSEISMLIF